MFIRPPAGLRAATSSTDPVPSPSLCSGGCGAVRSKAWTGPARGRSMVRWTVPLLLGLMVACGSPGPDEATVSPTLGTRAQSPTPAISPSPVVGNTRIPAGQALQATSPGPAAPVPTSQAPRIAVPGTPAPAKPIGETTARVGVMVGGALFQVELALTMPERTQGLSGRPSLAPGTGMLFVYEHEGMYAFWMKEMKFPLDLVWIDADCSVIHITRNASPQAADQTLEELPTYGPPEPARYVLEINAGEAESTGISVGGRAEFTGGLAGLYGC